MESQLRRGRSANLTIKVSFTIGPNGRIVASRPHSAGDGVPTPSFAPRPRRAERAVYADEPFDRYDPPSIFDQSITATFRQERLADAIDEPSHAPLPSFA